MPFRPVKAFLAQVTLESMGVLTAISATLVGMLFYVFKIAVSAEMVKQLDGRYVLLSVDAEKDKLILVQLATQEREAAQLIRDLQEAIRKIDNIEQRIIMVEQCEQCQEKSRARRNCH